MNGNERGLCVHEKGKGWGQYDAFSWRMEKRRQGDFFPFQASLWGLTGGKSSRGLACSKWDREAVKEAVRRGVDTYVRDDPPLL